MVPSRWSGRSLSDERSLADRPLRLLDGLLQVGVGAVEPVLARRAEDVHVERVLERLGLVRKPRGEVEDAPCVDVDGLRRILAEPEAQRALEDVRELLVL